MSIFQKNDVPASWVLITRVITGILLICIITGGIFITFSFISHAKAAGPSIVLSITSGDYYTGETILIHGYAYQPNEIVTLYWNYQGPGTGKAIINARTSSIGNFTQKLLIPLVPTGIYTIAAVGHTSGLVATAPFHLYPGIALSTVAEGIGTPLTITGNAYSANEIVDLYWNYTKPGTGTLLQKIPSNSTGSFTITITVPKSLTAHIPIVGVGETSTIAISALFVPYTATLALAPIAGSAATNVMLSAYGFQANETVNVYWNNGTTPILTAPTSQYGYMTFANFTIPAGTQPGTYPLTVKGQTSNISTTTNFTVVAPSMSLQQTSGTVGELVSVSGQGYQPGETINIIWDYTGTPSTVTSVTAGLSGTFSGSFSVPTTTANSYMVAAVGANSSSVTSAPFTITNSIALVPTLVPSGQQTTLTGTGFQPNEAVSLMLDSASGASLGTANADSNGNISQAITLPSTIIPGSHSIIATGQSSNTSFTTPFTVDTAWSDFGLNNAHYRNNTNENILNTNNVANLTLRWKQHVLYGERSSAVYANGVVYATTFKGMIMAFNATTGALLWQFDSHTQFDNPSSPLLDPTHNMIFFGLEANAIPEGYVDIGVPTPFFGLDATTGTLKWSFIMPLNDFGFPTLYNNTVYFGGSNEGNNAALYAVDEISGIFVWQHPTNAGVWGAPAVDTVQNIIFTGVGNPVFQLMAVNASTGATIWQVYVPNSTGDDDPCSGVVVSNGLVYLNGKSGYIYAFNESNGALVWSHLISTPHQGDVSSPALDSNGNLYVGSLDGNLYAFNASTGALLWKTPTGGSVDSSPAIANGVIYVASQGSNIEAINPQNGQILWSYKTGAKVYSSPIVVNGWLYCSSTDGYLYAFSL